MNRNPYANLDGDGDDEYDYELNWTPPASLPVRPDRWFALGRAAPFLPDGSSRANFEIVTLDGVKEE